MLTAIPKVYIYANSFDLVFQAVPNVGFLLATPDPTNEAQQFQAVYYQDQGGFALVCCVDGVLWAVNAPSGVEFPMPASFKWDPSWLWQFGDPAQNGSGLNCVRDNNWAMTAVGGASPVKPGTRMQMYPWQNSPNQQFSLREVSTD